MVWQCKKIFTQSAWGAFACGRPCRSPGEWSLTCVFTGMHVCGLISLQDAVDQYFSSVFVESECNQCQCRNAKLRHKAISLPRSVAIIIIYWMWVDILFPSTVVSVHLSANAVDDLALSSLVLVTDWLIGWFNVSFSTKYLCILEMIFPASLLASTETSISDSDGGGEGVNIIFVYFPLICHSFIWTFVFQEDSSLSLAPSWFFPIILGKTVKIMHG